MWTTRRAGLRRTCTGSRRSGEDEIDELIEKHAQNWRLERMPVVDRNLLRTAVAEMLGYPNTPARDRDQRGAGDGAAVCGAGVDPLPERRAGCDCAELLKKRLG